MNNNYSALDIANYIVWYVNEDNLGVVTPLKLQKILYYVSTTYLKKNEEILFNDSFEKWQYGPVVTDVYHAFKLHGFKHISQPTALIERDEHSVLGFKKIEFNPQRFLTNDRFTNDANQVIDILIRKEAFDLVEMTHEEDAWRNFETEIRAGRKELKYSINELKSAKNVI
ncbi:DUF4065 domain-containing protein [Acinetobacter dispersus]|uniref:Panacea domain-containing protein n=1 Tax=Acinetobacter dispersus TaxID=70348 RepID=UPI001F4A7C7D|nr:type II toxin-antitoxin system antitoxin SocA domain-containing protein [Acinetobacter dispersus]MCH7385587.1 DUF4065 domain-containing protein [Acinetobacter dispersus]